MFGSSIIDIAIGMVFVYLLLSLICSAANEIIERYTKKRASDLENGIKEMLTGTDKAETAAVVARIYNHPLIYSLFAKPYEAGSKNLPSYIPARNFALALMDLIGEGTAQGATGIAGTFAASGAIARLRAALQVNTTLPAKVRDALLTFVDASDHPATVRKNIEDWFDSSMDRVSGTYKRRSQLIVLILGLVLSVLLNVDSIALVRTLSTDRAMRDSLVNAATQYAQNNPTPPKTPSAAPQGSPTSSPTPNPKASPSPGTTASGTKPASKASPGTEAGSPSPTPPASPSRTPKPTSAPCDDDTPECRIKKNLVEIKKLGLPIGWTKEVSDPADPRQLYNVSWQGWAVRILGWLITALALSLGAPFWFDMLNKFIVIRSTVKPKEKSPEEKSKD